MNGRLRVGLMGALVTGLLLVAVVSVLALSGSKSLASTAVVLCINVVLVVSLQSFVGTTGILSFGHAAFMGIGAFTVALFTIPATLKRSQLPSTPSFVRDTTLPWPLAVGLAMLVCAIVAALMGVVLVRMTTSAMVMATFALLITAYTVLLNAVDWTRGSTGIFGVPRSMNPWIAVAVAVVFIVVVRVLGASRLGLEGRAVREDELAAASTGIDVRRNRYLLWVISAALMGAAGGVWALNVLAFDAGQFGFATTFALLAMLVVGGRESVLGAVVGAGVVLLVTEFFSRVEQGFRIGGFELPRVTGTVQFVLALLIILALIWRPEGIIGRAEIEELVAPLRRWAQGVRVRGNATTVRDTVAEAATSAGIVLEGRGLSRSFSGVRAVDGIDIKVGRGEILGLIGPNGSGKSTLLNLMSGVSAPDAGDVLLNGVVVTSTTVHSRARAGLGRTFQNIRLFEHLSVLDNISAPPRSEAVAGLALLTRLNLADVLAAEAGTLSYGQQRRLEIARALATAPAVILMDEPAAGMNEEESDSLLRDIRNLAVEENCGVIIIDHDLRLIMRLCDRIQVLETGRTIAIGTPEEIAENAQVRAAYLGDPVGGDE